MSESEPRRSVRATKGQHKALEQLDVAIEHPKRRGKKKKVQADEQAEEEIIRCVCGAESQDDDTGEPWIACDTCGAWQHNICMGMSGFDEDLPDKYFCEVCKPENHKVLLAGIARGEKPWEARRVDHERQEAEKKKKKGGRKGAGRKRASDGKDELTSQKSKSSPAPSITSAGLATVPAPAPAAASLPAPLPAPAEGKKEAKANVSAKRKAREEASQDKEEKPAQKVRKVSEQHIVPVAASDPGLSADNNTGEKPAKITDLPQIRQSPATALFKSLSSALGVAERKEVISPTDGLSATERAELYAIQIEDAVHKAQAGSSYPAQMRTLTFNLKNNHELCVKLVNGSLTPLMLATMTTAELASTEMQRETAKMKARAEKQAIKITEDIPRRRTDYHVEASDETPVAPGPSRKQSIRDQAEVGLRGDGLSQGQSLQASTVSSPGTSTFDIGNVFSTIKSSGLKSPSTQGRHPSISISSLASMAAPMNPGVDADVDRLLDGDGSQSPPYEPPEDADPEVVWRGQLRMVGYIDCEIKAKYVAGVEPVHVLGVQWKTVIPKALDINGRVDCDNGNKYLCSQRYSVNSEVIVASLEPTAVQDLPKFYRLIDYFASKKKYAIVGDKGFGNVKDTYLIPVPAGVGNLPEVLYNLEGQRVPLSRPEAMLLIMIVYRRRDEMVGAEQGVVTTRSLEQLHGGMSVKPGQSLGLAPETPSTPTAAASASQPQQSGHANQAIATPAFSPTSPPAQFLPPHPAMTNSTRAPPTPTPASVPHPQDPLLSNPGEKATWTEGQQQGAAMAREILGEMITSPTVSFLLPQAATMNRQEWRIIRDIYESDDRARRDLPHLCMVIKNYQAKKEAEEGRKRTLSESSQSSHALQQTVQQQQQQRPPSQSQPFEQPQQPVRQRQQPQTPRRQQQQTARQQQQTIRQPQQPQQPPLAARVTPIPPPSIPASASSAQKPPMQETPIPPPTVPSAPVDQPPAS